MTDDINGATLPQDILTAVEDMCRDVLNVLATVIKDIRDGKLNEAVTVGGAMRDLRAAFQLAMAERDKVEKFRKQDEGIVNAYALDFDKARDEIARRLDRLGRARGH